VFATTVNLKLPNATVGGKRKGCAPSIVEATPAAETTMHAAECSWVDLVHAKRRAAEAFQNAEDVANADEDRSERAGAAQRLAAMMVDGKPPDGWWEDKSFRAAEDADTRAARESDHFC
jgi:hypothetical protein